MFGLSVVFVLGLMLPGRRAKSDKTSLITSKADGALSKKSNPREVHPGPTLIGPSLGFFVVPCLFPTVGYLNRE